MKPDKFSMSIEDNLFYAKRNIVDSIYTEARLEGIGVTYPETNEIFNGRTVAGLSVDDTIKINNLKHAWQFIMDTIDYPVDLRYIRQVNAEVGKGIVMDAGKLRNIDVRIGGTDWRPGIPDEDAAREAVKAIMESSKSVTEKSIDMMLYIMRSQMFMDGNKRTAQITANKMMIEGGAGIITIPVSRQQDFIKLLVDFYESNDASCISDFLYGSCIDGISKPPCPSEPRSSEAGEENLPLETPAFPAMGR